MGIVSAGVRGSLQNRQARPLNGMEVRNAIENHLLTLTGKLLDEADILSDVAISLLDRLKELMHQEFRGQTQLQKVNITYPRVGWYIRTRLEELEILDSKAYSVNAEVELDLERNNRLNLQFGKSGLGRVIKSKEDEKISEAVPDRDRETFGLKVEADYLKPDGSVGKVDIAELRRERRAARTVDVGSGAENRVPIELPSYNQGVIETKEVLASGGEQGNIIVTPDMLPEISLDMLDTIESNISNIMENPVATPPPQPPKEPLSAPLPPKGGMNRVGRPNVKIIK